MEPDSLRFLSLTTKLQRHSPVFCPLPLNSICNEVMKYIWKSYMCTAGWRIIWKKIVTVIDATFAVAKRKPEEIQACQDSNPWPLWYRCIALPVELTSQLGAGRWINSYYTRKTMYDFHIFITSSSSFHGFNTNQFNKVFWWLERNLKAVIVSTNPL